MSSNDAIDFTLFDPKALRQAVRALEGQPPLDRYRIIRNEQAYEVAKARLDQIWSIYLPLSETYIGIRRKQDKKYEPETDPTLDQLRRKIFPRTDKLLADLEKHHAINMQVSAARLARTHLCKMLVEVEKILELVQRSAAIEKSTYLPPTVDTENH